EQAVDLERRTGPGALERRIAAFAEHLRNAEVLAVLLLIERQTLPRLPLGLFERPDLVVEAGNLDPAAAILHLRQDLCDHECGVGNRTTEHPRMQVGAAAPQVDLAVDEPAEAVAHRRNAALEHPGV